MPITTSYAANASLAQRQEAIAARMRLELDSLARCGVRIEGNGFSPIVLVKGLLNAPERGDGKLLAGADGAALRAALTRLGWAPEHFCAVSAVAGVGDGHRPLPGEMLPAALFRETLETLDCECIVLLDDIATSAMRDAYATELASKERFEAAMLRPGIVTRVLGRRVMALDGFEAALGDPAQKQRMWAYLKQLKPLRSPW